MKWKYLQQRNEIAPINESNWCCIQVVNNFLNGTWSQSQRKKTKAFKCGMNSESSEMIFVVCLLYFCFRHWTLAWLGLVAIVSSGKFWGASCIAWHQINERTFKKWTRNIHTLYNDAQNVFSYVAMHSLKVLVGCLVFRFRLHCTDSIAFIKWLTKATMKNKT